MNHFAASRDPDVFEEPDKFLPERWMRSATRSQSQKHPFASLPFGSSSRSCIGMLYTTAGNRSFAMTHDQWATNRDISFPSFYSDRKRFFVQLYVKNSIACKKFQTTMCNQVDYATYDKNKIQLPLTPQTTNCDS